MTHYPPLWMVLKKIQRKYPPITAMQLLFRSVTKCTTSTFAVSECKVQGAVSRKRDKMNPAEDIKL